MSSVDNRAVNMQFNGSQFLSGVGQAIGALERLDKALNLTGSQNGLDKISKAADKINLSHVDQDVQSLANRFSTLGVVGMSMLNQLSTRAFNVGANMINALTVAPVAQGWNEMELKMKSVQTILANTSSRYGTTIDDVTGALDELNQYADKTIYNFAEMTQNIGRFTTAGIDLDTSVEGIKGLANLGAFFNADNASVMRAMYQMSQGLAAGSIKLMDWNSLVNANMGGSEFVEDIERVARKHGVAIDDMIAKEGSFRETLRSGWLTNDIFLESLNHFATDVDAIGEDTYRAQLAAEGWSEAEIDKIVYLGRTANEAATKVRTWTQLWDTLQEEAGSGWAQTWETIFGNFEESTELFNGAYKMLNPLISGMGEWRNNLLEGWKNLGGRDSLIGTLTQMGENGIGIFDMIAEAAQDAFDINPQGLYDATEAFGEFIDSLQLGGDAIRDAQDTFEGFFSFFDIIGQLIGFGAGVFGELFQAIFPLFDGILDLTGLVGGGISGFDDWLKSTNLLSDGLKGLHDILQPVRDGMKGVSDFIGQTADQIKEGGKGIGDAISSMVEDATGKIANGENPMQAAMDSFFGGIQKMFSGEGVDNAVSGGKSNMDKIGETVSESFKGFTAGFRQADDQMGVVTPIVEDISGGLAGISSMLGNVPWGDILAVVGIFGTALAFKELSNTFNAVKRTVGGFKGVLDGLKGMFNGVESLTKDAGKMMKYQGLSSLVSSIALVVAALAGLTAVEGLNPGAIERVLVPLSIILGELVVVTEILARGKLDAAAVGRATTLAAVIDALSLAFVAIAASLALLGDIQPENLTNATVALGALFALLGVMEKFMSTNFSFKGEKFSAKSGTSGLLRSAATILAMAGAMKTIAEAVAGLGSLNPESLQNGLNGMIQIMGSLALLIAALGLVNSTITTSGGGSFRGGTNTWRSIASMIVAVEAIKGLAEVVQEVAYMPAASINRGISTVSTLALGLVGMLAAMSAITNGLGTVTWRNMASLGAVTLAIGALSEIAAKVADIPEVDGAINSIAALATILTAVVGIMSLLNTGVGQSFGQSMLMLSFLESLKGMVGIIKDLSGLETGVDLNSLLSLIALLGGLVASVAVLSKSSGSADFWSLLAMANMVQELAKAITMLSGIPIEGVASALIALAGGLTILGVAASALGSLGGDLLVVAGAFDLFALGAVGFAAAIWLIAGALATLSTLTGPALANLAMAIPKIIESIANGVMDAIEAVSRRSGELVPALIEIFTNALKGVAGAAGELAKTVVELLIQTFKMVGEYAPQLVDALVTMLCNIFDAVGQNAGRIMGSIKGLVDAIGKAFNESFGELKLDPAAVDEVMTTMYEIFALIALMKFSGVGIKDAIKVAGELLLVFGPMVGLFALISLVADQDATAALEQINNSIAIIAAVCVAFSVIPVSGAANAIVGLDAFIADLVVVLTALGALRQIPGLEWLIGEGGDFLAKIGEAIGKFVGGIGGGIASQFSESFGPIGENLAEFANNAGPFFEMIQGMDGGISEKVDTFKQVIDAIGGMALNGQYGTQKLDALGEFLPELAETMKTFSEDTKDLNVDNVSAVSGFLDAVSSIIDHLPDKVPGTNTDNLFGQMTLSQFGTELTTFAGDLKEAIAEIGPADSFDTSGIIAVIDVATQLNTLQSNLPTINDGGSAWWTGSQQNLGSFAANITDFSEAMKGLIDAFPPGEEQMDLSGVQSMLDLAGQLATMQEQLAEKTKVQTGWFSWEQFEGLGEFGNQIAIFADKIRGKDLSFKEFGEEGDYSPARARNLISLISGLADIQIALAEVKTTSGWGGTESVMQIGGLAQGIADHIDAFTTIAGAIGEMAIEEDMTTKFENFGACLEALAGVQARLMGYDGTGGDTAGTKVTDLATFVSSLAGEGSTFLTDIQALTSGSAELDPAGISNLQSVCAQLGSLITTLGTIEPENVENIDSFVDALERIRTAFGGGNVFGGLIGADNGGQGYDFTAIAANITALAGAIPGLISAFDGLQGVGGEGGEGIGTGIQGFVQSLQDLVSIDFTGALEGIQGSVEQIKTSVNDMLSSMSETFTAKAEEFRAQGAAMGTALIDGMNSVGTGNASSLEGIAQQALDAIAGKLGDFYTKGQESGQKYVDGVTDQQGPAGDAGEGLGSAAAAGAEGGYNSFYSAGYNAAQGYVDGIEAQIDRAEAAASRLASVAINATNSTQQSHSPSRVFRRIGRWAGQGYSLGIRDEYDNVESTAYDLVSNALDVAYELSQRELDFNPKIEPVVDLTKMGEGLDGAMHMLNGLQATANDTTLGLTADVQGRFAEAEAARLDMPEQQQPVNNVTYNQTINSPKALSRTDIWRDTKSLLAQKKEAAVR